MDNLTTVITFTLPHDAHFAKAKLQSEGVEVFMKDEMTAHVNHLYSGAIGGVKLQVRSADVDTAHRIQNNLLIKLDKQTSTWPLVGRLGVELRLLVAITVVLAIVVVTIVLVALP